MDKAKALEELAKAYAWEFHSMALYAMHSEAIHGLQHSWLKKHMDEEFEESFGHAKKVKEMIGYLGGMPPTKLDFEPIRETRDAKQMLEDELKNEQTAAAQYKKIMDLVKADTYLYHEAYHLMRDEMKSAADIQQILEE